MARTSVAPISMPRCEQGFAEKRSRFRSQADAGRRTRGGFQQAGPSPKPRTPPRRLTAPESRFQAMLLVPGLSAPTSGQAWSNDRQPSVSSVGRGRTHREACWMSHAYRLTGLSALPRPARRTSADFRGSRCSVGIEVDVRKPVSLAESSFIVVLVSVRAVLAAKVRSTPLGTTRHQGNRETIRRRATSPTRSAPFLGEAVAGGRWWRCRA
jgi:hypothetical protein